MKILTYTIAVILSLIVSQSAIAQFSLSGEFRPRTELSHGYKSLASKDQNASIFTAQRTRLYFGFNTEFVKTKLVLQDVRTWGSQPQLVSNEDFATSVHEAWAEVSLSSDLSLKAGRQELVYDDHRIFGNVGWAHQARSHDIAILKYEKDIKLHFGVAHNENTNRTNSAYQGRDAYKNLQFAWINKSWDKKSLSFLFLNNGKPKIEEGKEVTKYTQTMGGRLALPINKISLASNAYYQTGKSLSAYNLLLELSTKVGSNSNFLAGFEILSGTDAQGSDKNNSFTPLYGTNHKFNGFMDYFYVGNHMNSVGLKDGYIKYAYAKNKISLKSDLHFFSSTADMGSDNSNYLGTEVDLSLGITLRPSAKLTFGYSMLFASESMEILKGGDHTAGNSWGYVMLSVTPSFIK